MREPKVETGKRTMAYMSLSLAITAGGILLGYYLTHVMADPHDPTKPMNAILLENFVSGTPFFGHWFVVLTLVAEALLLTVAAQTGFIDGPRVMSNMALDSWLPHRFSSLSERLTTHYGVLFIGAASMAALWYTGGLVETLVTMYSINVFVTFCLSMLGMLTFYIKHRALSSTWKADAAIQALGLILCFSILCMTVATKFLEGAWMTLVITGALVSMCLWIRSYYRKAFSKLGLVSIDPKELGPGKELTAPAKLDPTADTAVLLVGSYGGLGIHSFTQIRALFPERFRRSCSSLSSWWTREISKALKSGKHLNSRLTHSLVTCPFSPRSSAWAPRASWNWATSPSNRPPNCAWKSHCASKKRCSSPANWSSSAKRSGNASFTTTPPKRSRIACIGWAIRC